jgi:hypothetical protein
MEFGQIIKKAWKITWRYRFLWVLGVFAGITGAGGGGGFNGRSFGSGSPGSSGSPGASSPFSAGEASRFFASIGQWVPVIVAGAVIWILIALFFWALSLAARAGLIWAVDEIEEGRKPALASAWTRGFSHLWSVLGLGLLLGLPMLVAVIILAAAVAAPIALAFARGGRFAGAAIVPVCGSLAIGLPLVLVMGFILGIMYVIGLRRIVLDGIGAVQSAKDAWKTFRARFKDTALMWLINWGLNIAAGLAAGIPLVIISAVLLVPAFFAGLGKSWAVVAVLVMLWVLVVVVVTVLYQAIWGTFTSSLWTILYRRLTGREIVVHPTRYPGPPPASGPAVTSGYSLPGQPTPPAGYVAPPVAGWAPPPPATAPGWTPDPGVAAPRSAQEEDPNSPPAGQPPHE